MVRALPAFLLAFLAAVPARGFFWLGPREKSAWRAQPIAVDGAAADWKDAAFDDDSGLSFAFANDDKDLYVAFSPHTKGTKSQLSGRDGQNVSLWLDPKGGKHGTIGLTLLAPQPGEAERSLEVVGIDTAAVELKVGDVEERGVLEARVPLSSLGSPAPEKITLELVTSAPTRKPERPARAEKPREEEAEPAPPSGRGRGRGRGGARLGPPAEEPPTTSLWIQVSLAVPPKP